jgi:hypothetical protein
MILCLNIEEVYVTLLKPLDSTNLLLGWESNWLPQPGENCRIDSQRNIFEFDFSFNLNKLKVTYVSSMFQHAINNWF